MMTTTNDVSVRIAALSPEKRALLERRLRRQGREFNTFPPSYAQQRLWFIDQLEPGNRSYIMPTAVRRSGPLDVGALERTFTEIVRRHEAVRTTFAAVDGQPVQVIHPAAPFNLEVTDLRALPAAEREAAAARLTNEEAQRPFDLARGPLLRASLLRLSEEDHVLMLTMHHIISDGWSMGVLFRELSELYAAFSEGRPSPLPELKIQYADYAQWQRRWLRGEVLERQLAYWEQKLAGAARCIALPTDRPRPPVQSYRGAGQSFGLTQELSAALRALGRRADATLFMTMLAAFKALLYRYTAQGDVVVGTPAAGRHRLETESLIGFFVNMLVLRTEVGDNPTFAELLGRVRRTTLEAYSHHDVPLEKIVEALRIERDASHQALFQVVFTLITNPTAGGAQGAPSGGGGGALRPFETGYASTPFDIVFDVFDMGRSLAGRVVYNPDLFNETTVARMTRHYVALLEEVAADPDKRLAEIALGEGAEAAASSSGGPSALRARLETEEFDF